MNLIRYSFGMCACPSSSYSPSIAFQSTHNHRAYPRGRIYRLQDFWSRAWVSTLGVLNVVYEPIKKHSRLFRNPLKWKTKCIGIGSLMWMRSQGNFRRQRSAQRVIKKKSLGYIKKEEKKERKKPIAKNIKGIIKSEMWFLNEPKTSFVVFDLPQVSFA